MLHKNSRERYEKQKRVFRRLMRNFNVDDLDDFIATANSMPQWMKNDPSLVQEQRDAIAWFTVDGSIDWQICNQVANRQKHVKAQRAGRPALGVNSVQVNPGARGILLQSPQSTPGTGMTRKEFETRWRTLKYDRIVHTTQSGFMFPTISSLN